MTDGLIHAVSMTSNEFNILVQIELLGLSLQGVVLRD